MDEMNHRKAFVLGENIREDLDQITRSERRIMESHADYGGRPGLSRFEDLEQRQENFQKFYIYPERYAGEIKFRVQMLFEIMSWDKCSLGQS